MFTVYFRFERTHFEMLASGAAMTGWDTTESFGFSDGPSVWIWIEILIDHSLLE